LLALRSYTTLFWTLYRRRLELDSAQGSGLFWYLADASLYILVHALVFARSAAMRHEQLPDYLPPVVAHGAFVCCGILPWRALAAAGTAGSRVFRANGSLIRKSRLQPAFFAVLDGLHQFVQFCAAMGVLVLVLLAAGYRPNASVLLLPMLLAINLWVICAVVLLTGTLGVFFPAMGTVWGMISRILLWTTPIVYARRALPDWLVPWLSWSPLWALVDGYRQVLLRGEWIAVADWYRLCLAAVVCFLVGVVVYVRLADDIPDFV